jgi:ketosteroid isomerase-like protein
VHEGTGNDRRSIEQVLVEYCFAVDANDIARVVDLFTDDATIDYGPQIHATGRTGIAELFGKLRTTSVATSHHLTNVCVDLTGTDGARVMSYVTAWHELVVPEGRTLVVHGRYLDRLQRCDGGRWQIGHRRLEVHGSTAPVPFHHVERSSVAGVAPT